MSAREFKSAIYQQLARVGRALASPRRMELLELLSQAPATVEVLARRADQTFGNASQHLRVLRSAGLVEAQRRGQFVSYRLADPEVAGFLRSLRLLAEARLAEIERVARDFLHERGQLEPVDREELVRRVRSGEVALLDVRPAEEYRAGHIPGAISVPLASLPARLQELPGDREIVAYCRGPYCVLAVEAVELLRAEGFRARRLEDGVVDWRARGFDIAMEERRA